MCPVCLTTAALILTGTTSTGGVTALIARKFRTTNRIKKSTSPPKSKENGYVQQQHRESANRVTS